jgi:heme ABC exporter ATP-binding subunit CcmA
MEPVVHLRDAVALLGRFPALAGIDLDVARGEVVLLRGPNGAGKTTVLRACAGLVPVVRGTAVVLGHDLRHDRRGVRRRVGLLGHATGLFDDLTVADNVAFWARANRADRGDAEAALGLAGLSGRLRDVPVARLSAGQRRRASLACLLVRRPELWLLDEPHAGLDHDARDLLDRLVRQAVAQGATVVMASHELDRAEALADRGRPGRRRRRAAPRRGRSSGGRGHSRGRAASRATAGPAGRPRGDACGVTPRWSPDATCASRPAAG